MNASIIGALGLLAVLALPVNAHEGHDHGDAPKPLINAGNLPQRLGDGSLFLPKLSQRQMGVLTLPVNAAAVPKTIELAGTVVPDPQRGGRVQTLQAGRTRSWPGWHRRWGRSSAPVSSACWRN
ncbi:MAG: hypothetical protein L6Q40_09980 [Azonexus sp.]|nr:hypothetical protein [Azonexus sp.]